MSTEAWRDYGGMLFAAGFIALGAWALWEARTFTTHGAIFPRAIASAMIACAIAYILVAFARPLFAKPRTGSESTPRRLLFAVLMFAWIALIPVLGFAVASLLAFVVLMVVANYDPWTPFRVIVYAMTAVCVVAGFYVLFAYGLKVPLPEGRFM